MGEMKARTYSENMRLKISFNNNNNKNLEIRE
jgi:hypothetical protein